MHGGNGAILIERLNAFCFTSRHGGLGVWNDSGEERNRNSIINSSLTRLVNRTIQ